MRRRACLWPVACLLVVLLLASCGRPAPAPGAAPAREAGRLVPVVVQARGLEQLPAPCRGAFVRHVLDYVTDGGAPIVQYESNGAGVALGDLDGDGLLDPVFANLKGENAIFWNQGRLAFRQERLPFGASRAVNSVDVDGDGWLDLVFTRGALGPSYLHNSGRDPSGRVRFEQRRLGPVAPAYAMAWGDLTGDSALDLVTGSYNIELEKSGGPLGPVRGAGVFYYEHQGSRFAPHLLTSKTQALAIALPDLNQDGRADILVGNDFATRDQAWAFQDGAWRELQPFARTSSSTMSYDLGDVDNDGVVELFAADMKPYDIAVETLGAWLPVMDKLPQVQERGDPQIHENMLQVRDSAGSYTNQGRARGVDATGWSWASKFGDLDNDGFLDLYVVNGMIAADVFSYLPGGELVEQNQAFRNRGDGSFALAPEWELGATASGRGMSMGDLDNDGDLDIVVNNLGSPALIFENQLCGGASLQVELGWSASRNTRALGAHVVLRTSSGTYDRDMRAGSAYLSGDPARLHFGFPSGSELHALEVIWPDGQRSLVERPAPNAILAIERQP